MCTFEDVLAVCKEEWLEARVTDRNIKSHSFHRNSTLADRDDYSGSSPSRRDQSLMGRSHGICLAGGPRVALAWNVFQGCSDLYQDDDVTSLPCDTHVMTLTTLHDQMRGGLEIFYSFFNGIFGEPFSRCY